MSEPKCMRLSRRRQLDHGHRDSNDQSKEMSHHLSIGEGQKSSLVWYLRRPARRQMGHQVQAGKWKERQDLARWDEVISDCFDLVSQSLARSMAFLGLGNRGLE
jgi:hypothetical protein